MKKNIEFHIRDGFENMDFDRVRDMLKGVFWSPGIKKEEVIQGSKHSALLVGAFDKEGNQVGFSRVVSDKTRFAYVLDVVVDEDHRGGGIGQAMMRYMLNHPDLKDVYQWVLLTRDAHEVYKKVGFKILSQPENWMEIRHPRPER